MRLWNAVPPFWYTGVCLVSGEERVDGDTIPATGRYRPRGSVAWEGTRAVTPCMQPGPTKGLFRGRWRRYCSLFGLCIWKHCMTHIWFQEGLKNKILSKCTTQNDWSLTHCLFEVEMPHFNTKVPTSACLESATISRCLAWNSRKAIVSRQPNSCQGCHTAGRW